MEKNVDLKTCRGLHVSTHVETFSEADPDCCHLDQDWSTVGWVSVLTQGLILITRVQRLDVINKATQPHNLICVVWTSL